MNGPTVTVTVKVDLRQWKGLMVSIRTAIVALESGGRMLAARQLREALEPFINCPGVKEAISPD